MSFNAHGGAFTAWRWLVGSLAVACAAMHAEAANKLWDNVNGGFFSESLNWFGGVPGSNDVARFETTNSKFSQRTYTVDFTTNIANQQLVVEDDGVTFNLLSRTYELKNAFVAAALGTVPNRSGTLNVTNGALKLPAAADLEIASIRDGSGALTVRAGGRVDGGPELRVGLNGNGTLNIDSGGNVTADDVTVGENIGSTGTVNIEGSGNMTSKNVTIGGKLSSTGTVNIEGGGNMTAHEVTIGAIRNTTVTGKANITGDDSTLFAQSLDIEDGNNSLNVSAGGRAVFSGSAKVYGALNIKGGGHFESSRSFFHISEGGKVTVDGMGSTLDASPDDMLVGVDGLGILNITDGGHVTNRDSVTVTGRVIVASTIPGIGSDWTIVSGLTVKDTFGTGIVRIQAGGTVHAQQTRLVGNGLLFLEGGTLDASELIMDHALGQFLWTAGTLRVGTCNANLTAPSAGILAPRLGQTGARIKGDYNQQAAGATLAVEIGGPSQITDFAVLTVEGTASLGGNLQIALTNGFSPTNLSSFDILRADGGLTGAFANVTNGQRLTTSDGAGSFLVNYGPGSPLGSAGVVISDFRQTIKGDFDLDGDVDGNDFLVWQRGGSPNHGNVADLVAWRVNFGSSGVAKASVAVPEPTGKRGAMAVIAVACAIQIGSRAVVANSHQLKKQAIK